MSIQEQQELKEKCYSDAMRYMDNAKDCLLKAKKEDGYYNDQKYVKMACGTAYNGVLTALDGYLMLKDVEMPNGNERKSIEFYRNNLAKIDKKILKKLNGLYQILHLWGYYDGIEKAAIVKEGFDDAYTIIEKLKPNSYN